MDVSSVIKKLTNLFQDRRQLNESDNLISDNLISDKILQTFPNSSSDKNVFL